MAAPTQTGLGSSNLSLSSLCWSQYKQKTNTDSFRFRSLVLCPQGPGLPHSPLGSQLTTPGAWAAQAAPYSLCPPLWEKRSTSPGPQSDVRAAPTLSTVPFPLHAPFCIGIPELCCCR